MLDGRTCSRESRGGPHASCRTLTSRPPTASNHCKRESRATHSRQEQRPPHPRASHAARSREAHGGRASARPARAPGRYPDSAGLPAWAARQRAGGAAVGADRPQARAAARHPAQEWDGPSTHSLRGPEQRALRRLHASTACPAPPSLGAAAGRRAHGGRLGPVGRGTAASQCWTASSPPEARVERVVEPLADEVDRQHREQDGHARDGAEPPGEAQHTAPGAHLEAPAHHVWI
jgi:hypothetical protein